MLLKYFGKKEVMSEVAAVLHEADDEGDEEDSINASDATASGSQGRDPTQGGYSIARQIIWTIVGLFLPAEQLQRLMDQVSRGI